MITLMSLCALIAYILTADDFYVQNFNLINTESSIDASDP